MDALKAIIRNIPDFPEPGIQFKDITPLLKSPEHIRLAVNALVAPYQATQTRDDLPAPTAVAGMEARGFIFGPLVAWELGLPFVPIRKLGKLPAATHRVSYDLEYGSATLEVHQDAIGADDRVLIVDDLLATGGTAGAAGALIEQCGARVAGFAFVIELAFLKGRDVLSPHPVHAVIAY